MGENAIYQGSTVFLDYHIFIDNKEGVLHKLSETGLLKAHDDFPLRAFFLPWDYLSKSFTDFFLASTWLSMGADPKLPRLALAEKHGTRGCLTGFTWTLGMLELL